MMHLFFKGKLPALWMPFMWHLYHRRLDEALRNGFVTNEWSCMIDIRCTGTTPSNPGLILLAHLHSTLRMFQWWHMCMCHMSHVLFLAAPLGHCGSLSELAHFCRACILVHLPFYTCHSAPGFQPYYAIIAALHACTLQSRAVHFNGSRCHMNKWIWADRWMCGAPV